MKPTMKSFLQWWIGHLDCFHIERCIMIMAGEALQSLWAWAFGSSCPRVLYQALYRDWCLLPSWRGPLHVCSIVQMFDALILRPSANGTEVGKHLHEGFFLFTHTIQLLALAPPPVWNESIDFTISWWVNQHYIFVATNFCKRAFVHGCIFLYMVWLSFVIFCLRQESWNGQVMVIESI